VSRARRALTAPLLLLLLAGAILGCSRPDLTNVGTTHPPAAPTRPPVDAEKVVAGLKAALGPDSPMHLKATADTRVNQGAVTYVLEGDFQGNEMDAHASFRVGVLQLSFDVIAADGKAYVRPYQGKWAKSPEKLPPKGSGPFGDMRKAKLEFGGPSKADRELYTINWDQATHAARALHGTLFSSLKVKSAVMQFLVDANGKPYTATYVLKGTGKVEGESYKLTVNGYYQFFAVREPLAFTSPMK
jgi:hypothetical protein